MAVPYAARLTAAVALTLAGLLALATGGPGPDGWPSADGERAAYGLDSLRSPQTREQLYFVLTDRFANGDPTNDLGGATGDRLATGFDPRDEGFFHGGDLAGVRERLGYIQGLGTTAIWLTPAFVNAVVQGENGSESAGYHGYWVTDFTRIDPHLGTNEEMKALVDEAHALGMRVYLDIITNHTADGIAFAEGEYGYRDTSQQPYTPVARPGVVKTPAWLNDLTMYHNRGDSTFEGESSLLGDFFGLDDLATERPEVVAGMGEIYRAWLDMGVDGFRIDTVKHVNLEFWQQFAPALQEHARELGRPGFFAFGEVYDADPAARAVYSKRGRLQASLDFGFQAAASDFAAGGAPTRLADLYDADDRFTDADSNAYQLPTFLGNHDMGRLAGMVRGASADDAELLRRVELAHSLMFLTRGNPVVYYGDEQGLVGTGGDKAARQDLFATQVESYAAEPVLGGPAGPRDRYDPAHPIAAHLRALAALRAAHPALADGAQVTRYAAPDAGVFAVTRYDRQARREYLVLVNNATTEQEAQLSTWTPDADWAPLLGGGGPVRSDGAGALTVRVPALSAAVYLAGAGVAEAEQAPTVTLTAPAQGAPMDGSTPVSAEVSAEVGAAVPSGGGIQVTFLARPVGTTQWLPLGTDDAPPYRVYPDLPDVSAGTAMEFRAVAKDPAGRVSTAP